MIAEEFGANATYVEGLLERFRSNPDLVDDSWRSYFTELVGDGNGAKPPSRRPTEKSELQHSNDSAAAAPAPEPKQPEPAPTTRTDDRRQKRFRCADRRSRSLKTWRRSLSVPTATSERRIPVKLLDENRRIINQHLAEKDRGKASYTHLIAWAMLRALEAFPQLNDGYTVINDNRRRLKRPSVNLGIAVDLTKKDGSRTLLVPNIKNANTSELCRLSDCLRRRRQKSA